MAVCCFAYFHVSGVDVQFICAVTDKSSLYMIITGKRIRFLEKLLRHHSENDILYDLGYIYVCVLVDMNCRACRVHELSYMQFVDLTGGRPVEKQFLAKRKVRQ